MEGLLVDYTDEWNRIEYPEEWMGGAMVAHGKQEHFLALEKLDRPYQRSDGKRVSYRVTYRSLSEECKRPKDQVYVCVKGEERTYWSKQELLQIGVLNTRGSLKTNDLFNCFQIM